jgi:hypothetical protein
MVDITVNHEDTRRENLFISQSCTKSKSMCGYNVAPFYRMVLQMLSQ